MPADLGLEGLLYAAVGGFLGLAALAGGRVLTEHVRRHLSRRQEQIQPGESSHVE